MLSARKAGAVVGAALAFSWFFILEPSIARLYGNFAAKFLTFYFPTGDLLLVAVGSFSLFNAFSPREQESVLVRLFWGLSIMALCDSLLAYEILNVDYRTGLLRIILNPLSVLFIGLAAIKYPQAIAHEQERLARATQGRAFAGTPTSPIQATLRAIVPFLLALFTCAILITSVVPRGGAVLVQASLSALLLIVIVVIRQALTMIENTRLTSQMRGELVLSRRKLNETQQEVDAMSRNAQEKRVLEDGIAILRNAHARVARGDFSARATVLAGPLMPIAVSFNLMLDRLSFLKQQTTAYEQLRMECRVLQDAVDHFASGTSLLRQPPQGANELRPILFRLTQFQRTQQQQWETEMKMLEAIRSQTQHVHEGLTQLGQKSRLMSREQVAYEDTLHALEQLEQQVTQLFAQLMRLDIRANHPSTSI